MRKKISQFIPPVCFTLFERVVRRSGYFGNYSTWREAQNASTGYDADLILDRVKESLLKVKSGEAAYERDSVLFDEVHYSWPLLAGLLWIASRNGNRLSIVDFGGSLGSSYFQNRKFLEHLPNLHWSIVEQDKFVVCGQQNFQDDNLKFYHTLNECLQVQRPGAILLSSVLPYLEEPYALLSEIVARGFDYILIDRTPLLSGAEDRITVQKVPPVIYEASYPAWILGKDTLLAHFSSAYDLVAEFDALSGRIPLGDAFAQDKGFLFKKREAGGTASRPALEIA